MMEAFVKKMVSAACDAAEEFANRTDNKTDDVLVTLACNVLRHAFGIKE